MSHRTKKHGQEPQPQAAPQPIIHPRARADLLLEAARGDPDSLDATVANTKEFLFRAAARFLKEREYSRAAWLTVHLSAAGELGAFAPQGCAIPWAWRIGQFSEFLGEAPEGLMDGAEPTRSAPSPDQCPADGGDVALAGQRESRGVVQWALGALNKQERRVVELCCLEGLSSNESASVLGTNANAIRNCLISARGRMELFFADLDTSKGGVQ